MRTSIFCLLLALSFSLNVVKAAPIIYSFAVEWCDTFSANCDRAAAAACGAGAFVIQSCSPVFVGNVCQTVDSLVCNCAQAGGAFVPLTSAVFNSTVASKFCYEGGIRSKWVVESDLMRPGLNRHRWLQERDTFPPSRPSCTRPSCGYPYSRACPRDYPPSWQCRSETVDSSRLIVIISVLRCI